MTYILFNPIANNGKGTGGLDDVRAALAGDDPVMCDITGIDTASFLTGLGPDDRVILCGGDGTLHRMINDLGGVCPAVPIYMWRFGTGNDFLRDVDERNERMVLISPHLKNLPSAGIHGQKHFFLNGCSGGVDALVCRKMNEEREKKTGYVKTALRCFFREYRPVSARVTVDGETHTFQDVWLAGAMNGRYQGGGMLFGPGQDRAGDQLLCYVWHGTGPLGTLLHFPAVIKGSYTRFARYCEIRRGHEITVEFDGPLNVQMDGETVPDVTSFTIRKGAAEAAS